MITDQAIATEEAINAGLTEMSNFWYRVIVQLGGEVGCCICNRAIFPGGYFRLVRVKTRIHRWRGKIKFNLTEAKDDVVIICRTCDPEKFSEDQCRIADKFKNKTTENYDIT